jgi:hypothetical protein
MTLAMAAHVSAYARVGRELERVAEGLVAVAAAHPAGQVRPGRHQVLPAPPHGGQQGVVVELDGHVDGAAVEVELPHGVAGHGGGLPDRFVVLPVGGAEASLAQQPPAPQVEHAGGQAQEAPVAGDPGQLDQRHLDTGVPVDPVAARRPELLVDPVGGPHGDGQEPVVGEGTVPGDRRLDQVPDAVELVAPGEVAVRDAAADHLDVAVEVAVGTLGRRHQADRLVSGRRQAGVRGPAELPAHRLQPLVDVGVQEGEGGAGGVGAGPVAPVPAGRQAQVVQGPPAPQLVETVGDGALPVDPLALGQEPVQDRDPRGAERAQPRPRRPRRPGVGAHFTAPLIRPVT